MLALQPPQVKKAEGGDYNRWWTYRAPKNINITLEQLQRMAASKLGAAAATGIADAATTLASNNGQTAVEQQVPASDHPQRGLGSAENLPSNTTAGDQAEHSGSHGSALPLALIQRWILAEVGLAAQKQLRNQSANLPQVVKAANSFGAGDAPLVMTAEAAQGSGEAGAAAADDKVFAGAPPGSKNQDPGIPVDPEAVANPGEPGWHQFRTSSCG